MMRFLQFFSGPRYRPEIIWSSKSWVHNIFRCYELIFGRHYGIRAEMTTAFEDGKVTYYCRSWESVFALFETYIRDFLWSLRPFRIYIPILKTPQGIPFFASPYLFAIALDVTTDGGSLGASPKTFAHVCTGSNLLLWVMSLDPTTGSTTSATYNSVSMTNRISQLQAAAGNYDTILFNLAGPATGSNTVSISDTVGLITGWAVSYSGCKQDATPDATATFTGSGGMSNPSTVTVTTVANNCWVIALFNCISAANCVASTGTTQRQNGFTCLLGDSNAAITPAGNYSMSCTNSDFPFAGRFGTAASASFAPLGQASTLPMVGVGT